MHKPRAAPPIPTDRPWLLNPKYPGAGVFYYGFIHEDHHGYIFMKDGEPWLQLEDHQMDYYGGHGTLLVNVEQYRNFPGNLDKFQAELSTPYPVISPRHFLSMTKKQYIYKRDLFPQMQMLTKIPSLRADQDNKPLIQIMAIYSRTKEEMMEGKVEFAPFEVDNWVELGNELTRRFQYATHQNKKYKMKQKNQRTMKFVFDTLKSMLPVNRYDPEFTALRKLLMRLHELKPVENNHTFYEFILNMMYVIIDEFDKFIRTNKSWFLPYPVGQNATTAYVRVFKENKNNYVLGFELLNEMKRCGMNTVQLEEMLQGHKPLFCLDIRDVIKLELKNVERIVVDIVKSHKTPVWFPSYDGSTFCLERLNTVQYFIDWIHTKRYFQDATEETRDKLLEALKPLKTVVDYIPFNYRIISEAEFNKTKAEILQNLKNAGIVPPAQKREVRQIPPGLWTEKQLVEELKYLDLGRAFPEILKIGNIVFKIKELDHIRTVDMFTAVEMLQFFCVIRRIGISQHFFIFKDEWFEGLITLSDDSPTD
ncbi:hypothetical protein B9Z55_017339 [Caenorhabditis nigoni]|uniref:DUF7809 domain-containing protein n=1 Tax=Caenorhabditis nigoni TaxID=1611254 RepID=A0A2G5T8R1_9PELO|nr:hypothetical protein B9Z55_017339 [Caenorhabditis nigoni]